MFGKKKKEFVFEDEGDTAEGQEVLAHDEVTKAPAGKKAASTRSLLLLLLLVAVGGGGYFVMMGESEPPPPPPAPVVQRQAIPIAKPQPAAAQPAAVAVPTPVAEAPATPVQSQPAAVKPAVTPQPSTTPAAAVVAKPAEKPVSKTEVAAAEPVAKTVPIAAQTAALAQKAANANNFILIAGAYADRGNAQSAQSTVRKLGFEPQVDTIQKKMNVTRLRYGTFLAEEAPKRLAELKKAAPAAFVLQQGELIAVYAGSFTVRDKARTFADHLYQQQILVEEEVVKVNVPLQQVSFGGFAERGEAEQAAAKARAAGLEVVVQARR